MFFGLFMAMLYLATGRLSWLVVAGIGIAVGGTSRTTTFRTCMPASTREFTPLTRIFTRLRRVVRARFYRAYSAWRTAACSVAAGVRAERTWFPTQTPT